MDAISCIETRRSVRKYEPHPVPDEMIDRILRAAVHAPSAKNSQSWRFVVLESRAKERIASVLEGQARQFAEGIHSVRGSVRVIREAPVLITVHRTGEALSALAAQQMDQPRHAVLQTILPDVEIQGIAAAIQNMLLAAHASGLGGLWIADVYYAWEQIEAALEEHCPHPLVAAVALGYPAESPRQPPRDHAGVTVRLTELG